MVGMLLTCHNYPAAVIVHVCVYPRKIKLPFVPPRHTYHHRVVTLGQDIEQISRRNKVESGEGQSFGLQILG